MKLSHLLLLPLIACSSPDVEITEWYSENGEIPTVHHSEKVDSFYLPNQPIWELSHPRWMDDKMVMYSNQNYYGATSVGMRPLETDSLFYVLNHIHCITLTPFNDGYLMAGFTKSDSGASSVVYVNDLSKLEELTYVNLPDSTTVLRNTGRSPNSDGIDRSSEAFTHWKHSQATWLLDTTGIHVFSAHPLTKDRVTIVYSTEVTTGIYTAQLHLNQPMNTLHDIQQIAPINPNLAAIQTQPKRIDGIDVYVTHVTSSESGIRLKLINFGDRVVYIRY